ncbi:nephrin-like [Pollicipes pollicipes]|uniref:nephrin-like n=1 Tax=Pollicipes pollicipes TaxID=41117 RepID=UPI0018853328|nr:nephrin-like [Pollicipes pollicipes]
MAVGDPPGLPEISGFTDGEVVRIGEQKMLTCISRGGNPPAELVWLKNDPPKPPSILGYEPGTYLRAGERVSLSCVSQGGNPPATLTWYSGDVETASDTEVEDNVARSVITFEVDHKDNGRVYKCDSQNSEMGDVMSDSVTLGVYFPPSSLKLEVRPERLRAGSQAILTYPPEITFISTIVMVPSGGEAVLTCSADGNPFTSDMITWQRNHFNFSSSRVNIANVNGSSILTLYNVTKEDIGEFQYEPELVRDPRLTKSAAPLNGTAQIICRARGAPNVTFQWSKLGKPIDETVAANKYQLLYTQLDLVTWQSVLKIKDVQASDYATYGCVAHNELSSRRQELVLGRPSSPDPPTGLKVVNVSHDTATLSWSPGFNGGLSQMYRVRHHDTSSGVGPRYDDVQPENVTLLIVRGLRPSTEYSFAVMAYNTLGQSVYGGVTTAKTPDDPDAAEVMLFEEGHLPWIVIIVVSSVGALLLLLNVVLVVFFIRRRMRRGKPKVMESTSASEASTKSETLHMYGNETVSSMSVKSGESYTREDSLEDYEVCAFHELFRK